MSSNHENKLLKEPELVPLKPSAMLLNPYERPGSLGFAVEMSQNLLHKHNMKAWDRMAERSAMEIIEKTRKLIEKRRKLIEKKKTSE